jgi:peptidoglycan hydrolase-like protein with peptidoglycan-binding domain
MDAFTSATRSLRSWRWPLLGLAAAAITAAVLLGSGVRPFRSAAAAPSHAVPTGLSPIVRTDVIERQQEAGTLGFAGSYTIFNGASAGVITWLPRPGAIMRRGDRLYELDRRPVVLLYGQRPAIRDFASGMEDGGDVDELKRNLRALGFTADGRLTRDNHFDWATVLAVKEWQHASGLAQTGTIALGTVVFLPHAVRVSTFSAAEGATVDPGAAVLAANDAQPSVLVQLDPGIAAQIKLGDPVLVTMPGGSSARGTIAAIGEVASLPSSDSQDGGLAMPTIPVTISLAGRRQGVVDQEPVQVAITAGVRRRVLAVPISALLAGVGGGYAVRVHIAGSTRLVPVATGLFDELTGRVEISGPGLAPRMQVEVPAP